MIYLIIFNILQFIMMSFLYHKVYAVKPKNVTIFRKKLLSTFQAKASVPNQTIVFNKPIVNVAPFRRSSYDIPKI